MKILHYALGFPPYRTGGLTKFCMDLMKQQNIDGHKVAMMWPGKMNFVNKKIAVRDRGIVNNIHSFEVINPLPVPYDEGITDINMFMDEGDKSVYKDFLSLYKPDVIHIHTLMGLHKGFLDSAKEMNIRMVFTAHDFFPICPKVTMFRKGMVCSTADYCSECSSCNGTSLSINKIAILQSPIYRTLKDSTIVKKLRKYHRDNYLSEERIEKVGKLVTNVPADYLQLRSFYESMIAQMDIIQYNSSVTKSVYEHFYSITNSTVIGITHSDIADHRKKKKFSDHLRITYLGAQSGAKGYFVLIKALDKLSKTTKHFELNVYFNPVKTKPYIKSHPRYSYDELDKIFDYTDLFVAPSIWYETFGYTVLEALSYGVPVVISDHVGAKDILPEGAGIIIENIDSDKLCDCIKILNSETLQKMNSVIINEAVIMTLPEMTKMIEKQCYCF